MARLEEYIPIVGESVIEDLRLLASRLQKKTIQNINSTAVGGGVAEILNRMVPLLRELGVDARWDLIKAGEEFFEVTKRFHNALHGRPELITQRDFDIYLETIKKNIEQINIYADIVYIHDPQPLALIEKKLHNRWLWRCHIDISRPNRRVWSFFRDFLLHYDASVFSAPAFSQDLPIRQFLIPPSIDPLSDKNKELPPEVIEDILVNHGIDKDKPIITQISRFDYLKDPVGVIQVYKLVKKYIDCQLILAGGMAADDPEAVKVLAEVQDRASDDSDIHVLLLPHNDIVINALQRASTIIMQKSIREGFGLTVAEALWKAKPVVASAVGGIPLQIKHKYSGLLCYSIEGAAFALKQLLNSPHYAQRLALNGREHIKHNFLLTRHLRDYILLFLSLYHPEDIIYL
jgi:trehalose synthase